MLPNVSDAVRDVLDEEFNRGLDGDYVNKHLERMYKENPGLVADVHYVGKTIAETFGDIREEGEEKTAANIVYDSILLSALYVYSCLARQSDCDNEADV